MAASISNLTSGAETNGSSESVATAVVSPASGSVLIVTCIAADDAAWGTTPTLTVTNCATTWTQLGRIEYSDRRQMVVVKGVGPFTSEAISLSWSTPGTDNFAETIAWSVEEVTNPDDPFNGTVQASFRSNTSQSTIASDDVGTPGTNDAIFAAFGVEDSDASPSVDSPLVTLGSQTGLNDIRNLLTGWDEGALTDETPSCSVTSSRGGVIAFIVNGVAGGGGSTPPQLALMGVGT